MQVERLRDIEGQKYFLGCIDTTDGEEKDTIEFLWKRKFERLWSTGDDMSQLYNFEFL